MKKLSTVLIALAACGDNNGNTNPDAAPSPDVAADMTIAPWSPPTPFGMALALAGPDQLMSLVGGPGGTFMAPATPRRPRATALSSSISFRW